MLQSGARTYSPDLGRFIQQDPMGSGINWYTYVGNNPVVQTDPEGLQGIGDVDWGEAFDWADWSSHATAFLHCMSEETGVSGIGRGLRDTVSALARLVGPSATSMALSRAAGKAHATAARARKIQVDYQNLRRARGEMDFAGNRVTKGWSRIGTKLFRRGMRLRGAGAFLGKVSGWLTAGQIAWAYSKCFGR
jgi:uncharacterized protein RhaS with RHS repeats